MRNLGFIFLFAVLLICCQDKNDSRDAQALSTTLPNRMLDYWGIPESKNDEMLAMFFDCGAWFGFGHGDSTDLNFSGPILLQEERGSWLSSQLLQLNVIDLEQGTNAKMEQVQSNAYLSHIEKKGVVGGAKFLQTIHFHSDQLAIHRCAVENVSDEKLSLELVWSGHVFGEGRELVETERGISVITGSGEVFHIAGPNLNLNSDSTFAFSKIIELKSGERTEIEFKYATDSDAMEIEKPIAIHERIAQKEAELERVYQRLKKDFQSQVYGDLAAKCLLTIQANWRTPRGELKHAGLFPSYHVRYFQGFWAWDSWKHAAAISLYNPDLAQDQILAMYDYQDTTGFIPDCIFPDSTIEQHNFRNSKPPLSAWAALKAFEAGRDTSFLRMLYPKLVAQHEWWYSHRDHDRNGLCEYGSTDGTLIAAKWESGMDNAARFDNTQMLKNREGAYSMDQESVDLNAFLYAEKYTLQRMAEILQSPQEAAKFELQAKRLKSRMKYRFFRGDGWYYDRNIKTNQHIAMKGSEGWTPLWAGITSRDEAKLIREYMIDTNQFYLHMPFQTLSAAEKEFQPNFGYWRGPVWFDQSYFAVAGLKRVGLGNTAYKSIRRLLNNGEGIMEKGMPLRENYNPITGEGMEAEHFSWTAACILLMLTE